MSRLFEATIINRIKLSNRFVRSATYEGLANEGGYCTSRLTEKMAELADRSVGLIITSHTFVSPEGRARPLQLGIYKGAMISGLREMTEAVHRKKSRIILQLSHGGAHLSKATCISCNLCYEPILSGKGISCEVDNRLKAGK